MSNLCACGCGTPVKTPGHRFTPGHNNTGSKRKGAWRKCGYCHSGIWVFASRLKKITVPYCNHACKALASKGKRLREQNPNWRGGRVMIDGRPAIYAPDHPRANKQGYVYEHLVIAEKALGRPLKYFDHADSRNEVVHHIDEDKTNNRNTNLVICTSRYHKALHGRMRAQQC